MHPLAITDFLIVEAAVVVPLREFYGVVLGIICLQNHLAGSLAASRASGDLGEKLKGALGGAEVRKPEGEVGADYSHQCDTVHVMPLGDHLRAYQQIDLIGMELIEHPLKIVAAFYGVAVEPPDARLREGR